MRVGVPKEIKVQEYRVAITPGGVKVLRAAGATVLVESGAGVGSGFSDEAYRTAGAEIGSREDAWACDMVYKVKEPIAEEFQFLRKDLVLFTYLHLAAAEELAKALLESGTTGIAYETVEPTPRHLPLLVPMSAVAGRLAVQEGLRFLNKPQGGKGILLSGVTGTPRGKVAILGGGVVGANAAQLAIGLGAQVTLLDIERRVLDRYDQIYGNRISTMYSREDTIEQVVSESDLIIGAVLVTGAKAPHLVTKAMLPSIEDGSVIVDVAVDQGGCVETTRPTTHDEPTYVVDGVVHYCVANMPGAVPRTSTIALTNETLGYAGRICQLGLTEAIAKTPGLAAGINTYQGKMVHEKVAHAVGVKFDRLSI